MPACPRSIPALRPTSALSFLCSQSTFSSDLLIIQALSTEDLLRMFLNP